ncbi:hypothetical protein [Harryflintia acetispora]|uniref:Uncharacterized protein n=1 Tax=Harryflintia acetispora TaxID=1849041 RepID=A0A9X8UJV0_9FIRM|nr:hypothetical protein [Harryflintia acetispora]TCL43220.1 hypothetical protein EDD78_10680 [Harryflintia acetispora]
MAKTGTAAQAAVSQPEPKNIQRTIEELRGITGTSVALHYGACAAESWGPGKMVTQAEYEAAVKRFGSAPIGGKQKC